MTSMTNEERQKLCAELYAFDRPAIPKEWIIERGKLAAREIERLAARSNAEPIGWKLVPIEPTPAMLKSAAIKVRAPENIWEAMLSVAPAPPGPAQPDAPTHRDMAYFGASEAACYYYPGEDEQLLRDAYCRGAAEYAPKPLT